MAGGAVRSWIDLGGGRVRGLGLTTTIRYFTTFPIESLTSFLSFLFFHFFTVSLIVDFYCIFPNRKGPPVPQAPLFWKKRER